MLSIRWLHQNTIHVEMDVAMLYKYVLPKDSLIDKRSRFVMQEIKRLQNGCNHLKSCNLYALGKKCMKRMMD